EDARLIQKQFLDPLVRSYSSQDHCNGEALRCFFQSRIHRQGESLAVNNETSREQDGNFRLRDYEPLSRRKFCLVTKCKVGGVNTERNDRQLWKGESRCTHSLPELLGCHLQEFLNRIASRGGGANQRIPGFNRCSQQRGDRFICF